MQPQPHHESVLPLDGVRVLDLTRALAGPFCTTLLADLGADVIKVEPRDGDMIRQWGPFANELSLYHLSANRNKRSIALDFRSDGACDLLRRMTQGVDVVVENFRPEVLELIGLGQQWRTTNAPDVLFASISGYGTAGPLKSDPSFDQIAQGMSGLMSLTGTPDTGELRVGLPIADLISGTFCALGVTAALAGKCRGNRHHRVETSLLESMLGILSFQAQRFLHSGEVPMPMGNEHPVLSPYGTFRTADRPINIAAGTQPQFERLCTAIDAEYLAADPRFQSGNSRDLHRHELAAAIEHRLQAAQSQQWLDRFRDNGIPSGPVHDMAGVFADPQVQATHMVSIVDDSELGEIRTLRAPLRIDGEPLPVRASAPRLGEHTRSIMDQFGFDDEQVDGLIDSGVLVAPAASKAVR